MCQRLPAFPSRRSCLRGTEKPVAFLFVINVNPICPEREHFLPAVFAVPSGFFSFVKTVYGLSDLAAVEFELAGLFAVGLAAVLVGLAAFAALLPVLKDALHPVKDSPNAELSLSKKVCFSYLLSPFNRAEKVESLAPEVLFI